MNKLKQWVMHEIEDYKVLLRSVPVLTLVFLVIGIIGANTGASKELLNTKYLALDCGFLLSWMIFLCNDMLTKKVWCKSSNQIDVSWSYVQSHLVRYYFCIFTCRC